MKDPVGFFGCWRGFSFWAGSQVTAVRLQGADQQISRQHPWETLRMIKEEKYLRKQADKAQRLSAVASDPDISRNLMNLASGYRAQAKILKKKKPRKKD